MRIFVTGASGWIGSAVVPELLDAGHQVVGLARSEASADKVAAAGAEALRATLDDADALRAAAAASDGVIHLGYKHDLAFAGGFDEAALVDRRVVDLLGETLAASRRDRPLVIASGTAGLKPGAVGTEEDSGDPSAAASPRLGTEDVLRELATRGVRTAIVRLPPTVHGDGDHGFMATLVGIARERGVAGYIADGGNRWPAVHRADAARLFRLAAEGAPAGSTWHGVGEQGVPTRAIAEAIGRGLDVPTASIDRDEAAGHFTWLAGSFGLDVPASSALTRQRLNWTPTGPGLIEDLDAGHYFATAAEAAAS